MGDNCRTLEEKELKSIEEIVASKTDIRGGLIPILHDIQDKFGYIPYEAQRIISRLMNIPLSEIYGVITFYSRFTLKPMGKYTVSVCKGTACYVKGSDKILDKIEELLGIKAGETTEDGMYSVEATRCIGACGLAPVITINEDVYGKIDAESIQDILEKYKG